MTARDVLDVAQRDNDALRQSIGHGVAPDLGGRVSDIACPNYAVLKLAIDVPETQTWRWGDYKESLDRHRRHPKLFPEPKRPPIPDREAAS